MKVFFYSLAVFFLISCESKTPTEVTEQDVKQPEIIKEETAPSESDSDFPYDLSKPDQSFKLSKKLTEISALSIAPDGNQLVTVNDEQGKIFFLNPNNGKIEEEIKFGKSGDYEGIETIGDQIYVLKNNGNLYRVSDVLGDKLKTKEFNTPLHSSNDVEGLGYDKQNNRLLLACKGKPGEGDHMKGKRAVYAFDLETNELTIDPVFLIDRATIGAQFKSAEVSQKILDAVSNDFSSDAFAPSAIAVHPLNKDIYVLSSVGKLLIVLKPDGSIHELFKLDAGIYKQPEGICFSENGTLFISSEGKSGKGHLMVLHPN